MKRRKQKNNSPKAEGFGWTTGYNKRCATDEQIDRRAEPLRKMIDILDIGKG